MSYSLHDIYIFIWFSGLNVALVICGPRKLLKLSEAIGSRSLNSVSQVPMEVYFWLLICIRSYKLLSTKPDLNLESWYPNESQCTIPTS